MYWLVHLDISAEMFWPFYTFKIKNFTATKMCKKHHIEWLRAKRPQWSSLSRKLRVFQEWLQSSAKTAGSYSSGAFKAGSLFILTKFCGSRCVFRHVDSWLWLSKSAGLGTLVPQVNKTVLLTEFSATSKSWLSTPAPTWIPPRRKENKTHRDETVKVRICFTVRPVVVIQRKHKDVLQNTTYDSSHFILMVLLSKIRPWHSAQLLLSSFSSASILKG